MVFHPDKCKTFRVTRSSNPVEFTYSFRDQNLDTVQHIKYLDMTLSNNLSWKQHIHNITGKTSKTLGFLKRNLRVNSTSIKETAYKALVRPQVEYAAAVWDPGYLNDIKTLESVQRRSARWLLHRYHSTLSVTGMIGQLGWRSLANRRSDAQLTMFYKALHGLVATTTLQPVKGDQAPLIHWPTSGYLPAVPTMRRHSFPELLYKGMPFQVMTWLWPSQSIPSAAK